ncbi:DUF1285 domain-containing protein [Sphingomonas sp.]|uniref:DUF1285 domain-containing protein n=1 Tax=Sphingomonas sp. TaxID=28214 RepID=UPI002DD61A02|nr:DUF1285 domain-containing protein [Sphingomonas sp.]
MPMPPPPDLDALSIDEVAALIAAARPAPVEQWHPDHCGDSEMRIARDGTWFHQGSPIGRRDMVRKFATILRREADGGHVLVNPAEKLDIAVEDAPFVAVKMRAEGGRIAFQTNVGDLVIAGPEHPLRFEAKDDGPHPYIRVRGGLEALVARPVYYELANLALAGDDLPPGVWSDGAFFPLEPA